MKQNLVGKILGKIKIFVQDFVTIVTGVMTDPHFSLLCVTPYLNSCIPGSVICASGIARIKDITNYFYEKKKSQFI